MMDAIVVEMTGRNREEIGLDLKYKLERRTIILHKLREAEELEEELAKLNSEIETGMLEYIYGGHLI